MDKIKEKPTFDQLITLLSMKQQAIAYAKETIYTLQKEEEDIKKEIVLNYASFKVGDKVSVIENKSYNDSKPDLVSPVEVIIHKITYNDPKLYVTRGNSPYNNFNYSFLKIKKDGTASELYHRIYYRVHSITKVES